MKDSKNIYDLANDLDFQIGDYEKQDLTDLEVRAIKRRLRKSLRKRRPSFALPLVASLLLVTALFSQTQLGRTVYATAKSKVSEISYSLGHSLYLQRDLTDYSNIINQVVEKNGVGIKLSEVILDRDELIFTTLVHTEKQADYTDYDYSVWINGKKLRTGASGSSGKIEGSHQDFFHTYLVEVPSLDLDNEVEIRIKLNHFCYLREGEDGYKEEKERGQWDFAFIASGKKLQESTYSLPLDYRFKLGNKTARLEEFRYNPVSQKIYARLEGQDQDDYIVTLKGQDDLGNPVEFGLTRSDANSIVFRYENIHGDLSDQAKSIQLVPYGEKMPKESGRSPSPTKPLGPPFTIDLR